MNDGKAVIENLIHYIEEKGYAVDVLPGILYVYKKAQREVCTISWGISSRHLHDTRLQSLWYREADSICQRIEDAIERRSKVWI